MKKASLILVALIVLAQLVWLGTQYFILNSELKNAPRIIVRCDTTYHRSVVLPDQTVHLTPDSPLFGKSLWWDEAWIAYINGLIYSDSLSCYDNEARKLIKITSPSMLTRPLPTRPKPTHALKGMQEINPNVDTPLAAFWSKGEDGLWSITRLEAINSEEDTPRDGELRSEVILKFGSAYYAVDLKKNGDLYEVQSVGKITHSNTSSTEYYIPETEDWSLVRQHGKNFSMEIVLRKDRAPYATQFFVDGVPYLQALPQLREKAQQKDIGNDQ